MMEESETSEPRTHGTLHLSDAPGIGGETDPLFAYRCRHAVREVARDGFTRWDGRIANTRLAVFIVGVVLAWLAFGTHRLHPAWVAVPILGFIILVVVHDRVLQSVQRAKQGMAYYEQGMARIEDKWVGTGWDGADIAPAEHPYAADLDIFGPGSLFQLLCTAQTRAGGKILADWLCAPAPPAEVRARQAAVRELRSRIDLREELTHMGCGMHTSVFPETIAAWAAAPRMFHSAWQAVAACLISAATILSALALAYGGPFPLFSVCLIALFLLHGITRKRVQQVIAASDEPNRELAVVGRVLARLEREHFETPYLKALQDEFREGRQSVSSVITHLRRLLIMREASLNMFFGPVAFSVMWDFHFARAVDAWRCRHGIAAGRWIDAVGRLEALCSLSAYAYEHPGDPFPTISDAGPLYAGKGLGHPLLPAGSFVRNDVVLDDRQRLLILSGSNMSGKTVLLRTMGASVVMALAGAPVRAHSLTLSPLAIGATLNVHDAIHDGVSRFYAEIKRIRMLMDMAHGPTPLLFLFDEIFHGTNSCDRRAGAHAVLRGLLDAGAIGITTTHDLAITELAQQFHGIAVNVHFEDHLEQDRLVFEYKLCPGVVEKSNALDLMRAIGLQID